MESSGNPSSQMKTIDEEGERRPTINVIDIDIDAINELSKNIEANDKLKQEKRKNQRLQSSKFL
jgi:hypothetical protein